MLMTVKTHNLLWLIEKKEGWKEVRGVEHIPQFTLHSLCYTRKREDREEETQTHKFKTRLQLLSDNDGKFGRQSTSKDFSILEV